MPSVEDILVIEELIDNKGIPNKEISDTIQEVQETDRVAK